MSSGSSDPAATALEPEHDIDDLDVLPAPRPLGSLAVKLNAWYVVVFAGSLAALAALAVPAVRDALEREDTVVLDSRIERHVAVLAGGLPGYQLAVEHAARLDPALPVRVRAPDGHTVFEHGDVAAAW